MKKYIFLILAIMPIIGFSQYKNKCGDSFPITAEAIFQTGGGYVNGSINIGFINSLAISIQAGARAYDSDELNKSGFKKMKYTPTATMVLKHRFNGDQSKVVHAFGFTAGTNYHEASYRFYLVPAPNKDGTLGLIASYSNKQQFTAGFILVGIF